MYVVIRNTELFSQQSEFLGIATCYVKVCDFMDNCEQSDHRASND